jgi:dTDP-4-amino-4,6-dideoxygalactose transaminase
MQAAVLRVKLKRLDDWNAARQKLAQRYRRGLEGVSQVTVPTEVPDRTHVYHLYVIQHPDRDGLAAFLRQRGIATGLHYPIPVHRQPCYESLGVAHGSLPVTENLAPRILTLPMFPEMTTEQVDYVCEQIRGFS